MEKPIRYEVTVRTTGKVHSFKSSAAAMSFMDRKDAEYGAVICTRKAIWADAA